jgi:ABC-2 type transport system ATP-binding protein
MTVIEVSNLSKVFVGKRRRRVQALSDLSLAIESGEIFGFLGPNGAGKSTTIKVLLGLIRATTGSARVMGKDVSDSTARQQIGYLPENPSFYEFLSAEEYLHFVGTAFAMGMKELRKRTDEVLTLLSLQDARKRPIRSYSKGMVQRLGLAQALLHDPQVLILDEPMSGLDPIGRALVKEIMLDLKKAGKCIFFSTHITADVETVCDRVGVIVGGRLQSVENVEYLLREGIVGYDVRLVDAGAMSDLQVSKEELAGVIAGAHERGAEISFIEPRRRSLEDFFLDIVTRGQC